MEDPEEVSQVGRSIPKNVHDLIRTMSRENPLWEPRVFMASFWH